MKGQGLTNIGNDALISKMAINITMRIREIGQRLGPGRRIRRRRSRDIRRDGVARKEPDADALAAQLHGVDAAAIGVELLAVAGDGALDTTSGVVVGAVVAVCRQLRAGFLALGRHAAVVGRVQRHFVAGVALVDGLHDVDFAVGGPVGGVGEPEGGPGRAAVGRVDDVEDEEARVVLVFGGEAGGVAAGGGVGFGVVDAEDGAGGGGKGEVHLGGLLGVGVAGGVLGARCGRRGMEKGN